MLFGVRCACRCGPLEIHAAHSSWSNVVHLWISTAKACSNATPMRICHPRSCRRSSSTARSSSSSSPNFCTSPVTASNAAAAAAPVNTHFNINTSDSHRAQHEQPSSCHQCPQWAGCSRHPCCHCRVQSEGCGSCSCGKRVRFQRGRCRRTGGNFLQHPTHAAYPGPQHHHWVWGPHLGVW